MKASIILLPGDGIGPEIVDEAERVLLTIAERFGHDFQFERCRIGGIAIDETGSPLPQETIDALQAAGHEVNVGGPWSESRMAACTRSRDQEGRMVLRAAANPRGMQGYAVGR